MDCYKGKMMNLDLDWNSVDQIKTKWFQEDNHTGTMGDRLLEKHISIGQLLDFVEQFRPKGEYDPTYGDNKLCVCGHIYRRHFDPYENMEQVGCKYCECDEFHQNLEMEIK